MPLYPRTLWITVLKNIIEQPAFTGVVMTVEKGGYPPKNNPAQTLGDAFRNTRVAARVSVEQVEADLRIKSKYIEAIEDGDAAALPSRAYTDGFLRNYATYLGMDPADAVRRFADENGLAATTVRVAPAAPLPKAKKKSSKGGVAPAPRRGVLAGLGRMAAALGPILLVAGLAYGGYTGYGAARDAGLIPPELGVNVLLANDKNGEDRIVAGASAENASEAVKAEKPDDLGNDAPRPDEDNAPVETAKLEVEPSYSDIVGNETSTGRPDSLSYARSGNVPYWQAKPPELEPTDGPVADIKPETAGVLRATNQSANGGQSDSADTGSRWTAGAASEGQTADVDASRIAAAAREALFGASQPQTSQTSNSESNVTATETASENVAANTVVAQLSDTVENSQPVVVEQAPTPTTQPATPEPAPEFGVGPVVTDGQAPADLSPAEPAQAPRRFALIAQSDAWVQVTDSFGTVKYTGILSPGEAYNIPAEAGLRLKTGNAGGLLIEVEGQRFGPLGSNGAVMRNVTLNPGAVRASFTLSQAAVLSQ